MNDFEQSLLAARELVALPRVAAELLNGAGVSNPARLALLLGTDPALGAKLIRLANSRLCPASHELASLSETIAWLGPEGARSAALSLSFVGAARRHGDPLRNAVCRTSLMQGLAARRLARDAGVWSPDEAFQAGLVSNCGVLLLLDAAPGYRDLLERFYAGESPLLEMERDTLETDHARVADLLLEHWGFPPGVRAPIRRHFGLDAPGPEDSPTALHGRILSAAELMARTLTVWGIAPDTALVESGVAERVGVPVRVVAAAAAELPVELRWATSIYQVPAGHRRQRRSGTWESKSDGFQGMPELRGLPGELDGMTGLLLRGAFERTLEAFHRRARLIHRPISVLLLGLENLGRLEVARGPDVAREALLELARRVSGLVRCTDPHARFADHQLAILAPGCAVTDVPGIAERLRRGVEANPLQTGEGALRLKLAIGMAAALPHHDGSDAATLLVSAGEALDHAQAAPGRMCLAG